MTPGRQKLSVGASGSRKRARPVRAPKGEQKGSSLPTAILLTRVLRVLTFLRPFCSPFYLTNTAETEPLLSLAKTILKRHKATFEELAK